MLLSLAWKNIWRNPQRSSVLILLPAVSVWAVLMLQSLANGLNRQRVKNQIELSLGHFKLTHPDFQLDKNPKFFISDLDKIKTYLTSQSDLLAYSERINFYGMISRKQFSSKTDIYGVEPAREKQVFSVYKYVVNGKYLSKSEKNGILIGKRLSEKLNAEIGDSIHLSFAGLHGKIISSLCQVSGIYQIPNAAFEESHVFVNRGFLADFFMQRAGFSHQLVGRIKVEHKLDGFVHRLKKEFPGVKAMRWQEISPHLAYINSLTDYFFWALLMILLLFWLLSLLNAISVILLERSKELSILYAMGMRRMKIARLISLEVLFQSLLGQPFALALVFGFVAMYQKNGLDLQQWGIPMERLAYSPLIYPSLSFSEYAEIFLIGLLYLSFSAGYIYYLLYNKDLKKSRQ